MSCKVAPYEGNEPYIFFSYCHENADIVYPIIEKMAQDGFRIWYDKGTLSEEQKFQEIEVHLNNAFLFIAAMTKEADVSHACRNEINFMMNHNKKWIPVILEEFSMSLGWELAIASVEYIKMFEFSSKSAFYEKLYTVETIEKCRNTLARYIIKPSTNSFEHQDNEAEDVRLSQELENYKKEGAGETRSEFEKGGTVIKPRNGDRDRDRNPVRTDHLDRIAVFCPFSLQKIFILNKKKTKIGRSSDKSDIVISDPEISALHAVIFYESNHFYVRDSDSTNGTILDQVEELEGLQPVMLDTHNIISLSDERCLFATDNFAKWIIENRKFPILECEETDEIKVLDVNESFLLGRSNPWAAGTFTDMHVSRELGDIYFEDDVCILETVDRQTKSQTFLNGKLLRPSQQIELRHGDELRMGSRYHIRFYWMEFTIGE